MRHEPRAAQSGDPSPRELQQQPHGPGHRSPQPPRAPQPPYYDEESNRTSLTTRAPGSEGKCATEGGTVEKHTYDTANRLTDTGVAYETFGNTTTLPAADAGGHALTSSYYVDGQAASQTQSEKTINYHYDPAGRTRETETVTKGKTESTVISHYPGAGEALSWTSEEEGKKWSRNIPGIDGALDAIETSSGSTTLQLHDLLGNIVAKASTSETETKLLETYNSTEFGVPNEGKAPPKYAWLGAAGVSTELPSGVATKGGASYVPQTARELQTLPVIPPGAFPNGTGTGSPYVSIVSAASQASAQASSEKVWEEAAAARQKSDEEESARIHQQCVEEGGCGAGPEIEEDPIHYRAWEAQEKGEALLRLAAAGNLTGALGTLFGTLADYIDGYIEAHLTTEVAFNWLEEYGQFLEACVKELHGRNDSHGGCRASYEDILGAGVPDFWSKPVISYCLKMSSDTVEVHECTRLGYQEEAPTMV